MVQVSLPLPFFSSLIRKERKEVEERGVCEEE